jgi:hypothetical protein
MGLAVWPRPFANDGGSSYAGKTDLAAAVGLGGGNGRREDVGQATLPGHGGRGRAAVFLGGWHGNRHRRARRVPAWEVLCFPAGMVRP